jgi:hypothetical protein
MKGPPMNISATLKTGQLTYHFSPTTDDERQFISRLRLDCQTLKPSVVDFVLHGPDEFRLIIDAPGFTVETFHDNLPF